MYTHTDMEVPSCASPQPKWIAGLTLPLAELRQWVGREWVNSLPVLH